MARSTPIKGMSRTTAPPRSVKLPPALISRRSREADPRAREREGSVGAKASYGC
jgi:hypothetical protein